MPQNGFKVNIDDSYAKIVTQSGATAVYRTLTGGRPSSLDKCRTNPPNNLVYVAYVYITDTCQNCLANIYNVFKIRIN